MKYFTSDQHFGETRIGNGKPDLFFRQHSFSSVDQQDEYLMHRINEVVGENELIHLGDVVVDLERIKILDKLKSKFRILITGNYDTDKMDELGKYFDEIYDFGWFEVEGIPDPVYCNHYPSDCKKYLEGWKNKHFTLTGHIHGLWRVQRGILNVGCDAWHYNPLSEKDIAFYYNAMEKVYDENVFVWH